MDFTDLSNAYPNDSYPLCPENQEKIAFITDRSLHCYKVMSFRLKNAGATYQRLVIKLFAPLIV